MLLREGVEYMLLISSLQLYMNVLLREGVEYMFLISSLQLYMNILHGWSELELDAL